MDTGLVQEFKSGFIVMPGVPDMFNIFKNFFKKKMPPIDKLMSPKEQATFKGEPWVDVVSFDVDPENPKMGSFEIDWNQHFVTFLTQNGYRGKDDNQIVDQWFSDLCRHVALESYELDQQQNEWVKRKNLGNGRTEVS
jgi:hypothetical protein